MRLPLTLKLILKYSLGGAMLSLVEAEVNPNGCEKARDFAGFLLQRRRNPA